MFELSRSAFRSTSCLTQLNARTIVPMVRLLNVFLLSFAFYSLSGIASPFSIFTRQAQDTGYSTCAKRCFDPGVNASNCPFDTSGTRNACLCESDTFLTNFMVCTFHTCGGSELATAAHLAMENCLSTNTPSIYNDSQLVSIGQGGGASSTSTASSPTGECKSASPSHYESC
ncbi:hypothetical protein K461DRAFT_43033 [Myriangium duriaei CBS 260.36]|uniref:CFEM domain-containing protein n=1 Tax=Myriangium duriaei CBS 260.36 TaxID=1168546 RepID=A0A9P4MIX9_9PEZI|nr:hypothetical protein K461DRAFT_43033 [Myriangium duriaei CBS 260.36]